MPTNYKLINTLLTCSPYIYEWFIFLCRRFVQFENGSRKVQRISGCLVFRRS